MRDCGFVIADFRFGIADWHRCPKKVLGERIEGDVCMEWKKLFTAKGAKNAKGSSFVWGEGD